MGPTPAPAPAPKSDTPTPCMHVVPGVISTFVKKLADGNVLLHIEHATGTTSLPMTMAFAKGLLNQLQQATGGLTVPDMIPPRP